MNQRLSLYGLLALLTLLLPSTLRGIAPQRSATLWDHLVEVNVQWESQITDRSPYLQEIAFGDETERIRMHLLLVSHLLGERDHDLNADTQAQRTALLKELKQYALEGRFPLNHSLEQRTPFFIDHQGTACAVGHLLRQSGHGAFANLVREQGNNAYVLDMEYPQLSAWASNYGFTAEELAWIQPGYPMTEPVSNFLALIPMSFSPTSHIAVTAILGFGVFFAVTILGFVKNGAGFLGLFWVSSAPLALRPILAVIEVISYFVRPVSHSIRLAGNIMAGHAVLKVFAGFAALTAVAPLSILGVVAIYGLEVLVSAIQAYVFTILTCVYLKDALHPHH